MIRFQVCFFLSLSILFSGCTTNVRFNLSGLDAGVASPILVQDKRTQLLAKTKYEPAIFYIGESNLLPSPLELVSLKFNKILTPEMKSKIKAVDLNDFQLIIYDPQHAALLAGAAMAGASYSAGIMTEAGMMQRGSVDGVISKIKMTIDGRSFSCERFVPAYKEIGALVGPMVSGVELQKPFSDAMDGCISDLVAQLK